jgi:hypothetical protein
MPDVIPSVEPLSVARPTIQWVKKALPYGIKQLKREADKSPPSQVKNDYSYTSTSPYACKARTGNMPTLHL